MRKLIPFILIVLSLYGCAQMKQAKVDFESCWNDLACRESAINKAEDLKSKANAISVVSPIPGTGAVIAPIAGGLGLLFFLVAGGSKKRKENE